MLSETFVSDVNAQCAWRNLDVGSREPHDDTELTGKLEGKVSWILW
jgi:hypothetical protein